MTTPSPGAHYQAEWVEAYRSGESIRSIASRYGMNRNTVRRWIIDVQPLRSRSTVADQIKTLDKEGLNATDIAAQLNCSEAYVSKCLALSGKLTQHRRTPKYEYLIPQVVTRYEEGQSMPRIAKDLGISAVTVRNLLLLANVSIRSLHASSELYWTDTEYFHDLDSDKSYQLGVFWGLSPLRQNPKQDFLSFTFPIAYQTQVLTWMGQFTHATPERFKYRRTGKIPRFEFRIYPQSFIQPLKDLGIQSHCPTHPQLDGDAFWQGYARTRLRCRTQTRVLSISFDTPTLAEEAREWFASHELLFPSEGISRQTR